MLQEPDGWYPAISFSGGDFSAIFVQALWVNICSRRIADDVSSMPGVVQTRESGTNKWKAAHGHELNRLIRRPYGPQPNTPPWGWSTVMQAASIRLDFDGNAFFLKREILGELLALQLIQEPVNGIEDTSRVAQSYQVVGSPALIPAEQMVNVMLYAAGSYWSSPATIDAVQNAAAVDRSVEDRIRYDLEQRIAPGAVLKVKAFFNLDEEMRTATETHLNNAFSGAVKAGKPLVIGDNVTVDPPPIRTVDDLHSHHNAARDSVISGFHIAPPVVGVLKDAKYSNYSEALRAQWTFCIRPRLGRIYNTINEQAIWPLYGPDVRLWYELAENELGLEVLEMRAEAAKKLVDVGHPPINASERVGLDMPAFEGGDRPMMPLAVAGREQPQAESTQQETTPP